MTNLFSLSFLLAKADFKVKHVYTYFSLFWYLLNPVLSFVVIYLIFQDRLGQTISYYPAYLMLGIILLKFFIYTTSEATTIIFQHAGHIKSTNFPREALVLSLLFKNTFTHFFEITIFFIILALFGLPVQGLILYPFLFFFFFLFCYGVSLFLASITLYLVDTGNLWSFFTMTLWFVTPVFFEIGGQTKLLILNMFNPLYYFLTFARETLIYTSIPELFIWEGVVAYSLCALLVGTVIFKKLKPKFPELL